MSQVLGTLYAIGSGLSYGLVGFFGCQLILLGHSVYNMLAWRFLIAAASMGCIQVLYIQEPIPWNFETLKSFLLGCIAYSGCAIFYFIASNEIGSGLAMVIFFTYPIIVVLVKQILSRQWPDQYTLCALGFILVGVALLADPRVETYSLWGLAMGIVSATFYAAYVLFAQSIILSPIVNTFYVCLGSALGCLLLAWQNHAIDWPILWVEWGYFIGLGLISTALPILLFLEALRYISAVQASILSVLEPLAVLLVGVVVLEEKITALQMIGTILMLSGALVAIYRPTSE